MSSESEQLYEEMMTQFSKKCGEGSSSAQQIIPSICRVPERLREINPSAYTPSALSIGPLHRHDEHLQRWQEKKKIYMRSLLERTAKARECDVSEILRPCVNAMVEVAPQARSFYEETFKDDDREFAKLMLVDGCFILEFLYWFPMSEDETKADLMNPIFINKVDQVTIVWDLLLLENQIPFPVLKRLFQLLDIEVNKRKVSPTKYVLRFLKVAYHQFDITDVGEIDDWTECYHILDLLHKLHPVRYSEGVKFEPTELYYSATDLDGAGVNFKPTKSNCGGRDCLAVEFRPSCSLNVAVAEEKPQILPVTDAVTPAPSTLQGIISQFKCLFRTHCLRLPRLVVDDSTEKILRNLVAHEQCSPTAPQLFTSYAVLMDTLIDSKEDVELLVKAGVLKNNLGSNEDVTNLFNNLCKEITLKKIYYTKQWEELTKYRNLYWPKHIASLKRTYFGNPWAPISFCAALILFALTAIQTGYTVKSYFSSLNDNNKS